jgi:hypothetical protein
MRWHPGFGGEARRRGKSSANSGDEALELGRPDDGETHEISGFRQAGAIMMLCREAEAVDI